MATALLAAALLAMPTMASLTPVKRPPSGPAERRVESATATTFYNPSLKAETGALLLLDNCLEWGQKCGQPAADAFCRLRTTARPIAAFWQPRPSAGATTVFTGRKQCWDRICVGIGEIRCEAAKAAIPVSASVAESPIARVSPDPKCKSGYVWRLARETDLVCVTPESRERTARENARAAERRDPAGAYGPNTCLAGFVWREAYEGDAVCVTPESRETVREENRRAAERRAGG